MIINKITTGFVIQKFDTDKKKYISQEFIAGDQVEYENGDPEHDGCGDTMDDAEMEEKYNFGPYADAEPYLPFDMVQPLVDCKKCGSPLVHDRCTDETCPFSDKEQS